MRIKASTVVRSYLGSSLLNAPLFAIYALLPFILCKDCSASALQITALIAIKPTVAILSTYWSSWIIGRSDLIKKNITWAILIGVIPTALFPFAGNNWLFIAGFAAYFFAERAIIPAWMELMKISLPQEIMSRSVARGGLVAFVAASVIPVFASQWLDHNIASWRWLYAAAALLSICRVALLSWVAISRSLKSPAEQRPSNGILRPWTESFQLLRRRPDFAWYQLIFFFGGLGIMVTQPALPKFVEELLHLSYTQLAVAIALCKGIGFLLTNRFWARWLQAAHLYLFCSVVTVAAAGSLLMVLAAPHWAPGIYIAFLLYGAMQAGSQLSWQMAGPIFAGTEDSSSYTGVNIVLVGIRGCIGPFVGGFVCSIAGLQLPYVIGALLCLAGGACGLAGYQLQKTAKRA